MKLYLCLVLPEKLYKKLSDRKEKEALRSLPKVSLGIDFSSNDYLGVVNHKSLARVIQTATRRTLKDIDHGNSGATGSRLLTGNYPLYGQLEEVVSRFHESESALIFNSGYMANLGFFQCVPQRGDVILYDEYIHASIRDGIKMSDAKGYKFTHNSLDVLSQLLLKYASQKQSEGAAEIYVVTEAVFSMDGDSPDLVALAQLCKQYKVRFVVDEAHAIGVLGTQGQGLLQVYGITGQVFARIVTFGKAAGAHGAAILGSQELRRYLVNFARPFIYTTALPPHTIASILSFYTIIEEMEVSHMVENLRRLKKNINVFKSLIPKAGLDAYFVHSVSAIQCAVIPGVERVKALSLKLQQRGYDVKPILAPTVAQGKERLRFCIHSYNTREQIKEVLDIMKQELN